jgi:hypothetical protein
MALHCSQDALSNVRTQVLTGSVVLRDALLDPDQRKVADYRKQLEDIYKNIDGVLAGYVQVSESPAGAVTGLNRAPARARTVGSGGRR